MGLAVLGRDFAAGRGCSHRAGGSRTASLTQDASPLEAVEDQGELERRKRFQAVCFRSGLGSGLRTLCVSSSPVIQSVCEL